MKKIIILILLSLTNIAYGTNDLNETNNITNDPDENITTIIPTLENNDEQDEDDTKNNSVTQLFKTINNKEYIENEVMKQFQTETSINTEYKIDLTGLYSTLLKSNPGKNIIFDWEIKNVNSKSGPIFKRLFKEEGKRSIKLTISTIEKGSNEEEKQFKQNLAKIDLELFIYKQKSLLITNNIEEENQSFRNYEKVAQEKGIYLNKILYKGKKIGRDNEIIDEIKKFDSLGDVKNDYIIVWGNKDFIVDVFSSINTNINSNNNKNIKYNFLIISSYNNNILKKYIDNFIYNNKIIGKSILINDNNAQISLSSETGNKLDKLVENIKKNEINYIDLKLLKEKKWYEKLLFISYFEKKLINTGFSQSETYIFLIIPFLLTFIIFFRHFIGFSTIGLVFPLLLTILLFKFGVLFSIITLLLFTLLNILISIFINRFNILYFPKMVFILSINIIFIIVFFDILYFFDIKKLDFYDTLYLIIFIVINEKILNIIISKDLTEYKKSFLYTIIISLITYLILSIDYIELFITLYPEIILILLPINFLIGRFSGLRVTEYFRFKEVIRSVEEEE